MKRNKKIFQTAVVFAIALSFVMPVLALSADKIKNSVNNMSDIESNYDEIFVSISFEQPTIEKITLKDTVYDRLVMLDAPCSGNPGGPLLPSRGLYILLPYSKTVKSIEVTTCDEIFLGSDILVLPGSKPIPLSQIDEYVDPSLPIPDKDIYSSTEQYPIEPFKLVDIQNFRGYDIAILCLYPVRYVPASGKLSYYKNMEVTVKTEDKQYDSPVKSNINGLFRRNEDDKIETMKKVYNPDMADTYPTDTMKSSDIYDLLIITIDGLKDAFENLKYFHDYYDVNTVIKTLYTDIPVSGDICEDIRDYITDAYNTWGIEYVLIGGDDDLIPAKQLYFGTIQSTDIFGPSDLYYSCLGGNLNDNNVGPLGDVLYDAYGVIVAWAYGADVEKNPVEDPYVEDEVFGNYPGTGVLWLTPEMYGGYGNTPESKYGNDTVHGFGAEVRRFVLHQTDLAQPYVRWQPGTIDDNAKVNTGDELTFRWQVNGSLVVDHTYLIWGTNSNPDPYYWDWRWDWRNCTVDNDAHAGECLGGTGWDSAHNGKTYGVTYSEPITIDSPGDYYFAVVAQVDQRYANVLRPDVYGDNSYLRIIKERTNDTYYEEIEGTDGTEEIFGQVWWYSSVIHVNVSSPLHACAHGSYLGFINEPVLFAGSITGGFPPYSWHWDFGDGNTSDQQNPTHTYVTIGEYTAMLTVTDSQCCTASDTASVTIGLPFVSVDDNYDISTPGWGYDHFDQIQDGIEAVGENGTVYVYNGTYYENIHIDKAINLIGECKESTIVDGGEINWAIHIDADGVNITGFTIQTNGFNIGIAVCSSYNHIYGNIITDNVAGIHLFHSCGNTIAENNVTGNEYGIWLYEYSTNNNIKGNNIVGNQWFGIFLLDQSSDNIISENDIENNHIGIRTANSSKNNVIYHNNFINNIQNAFDVCNNVFDDGYPYGGNYWYDHPNFVDEFSGPNQDEPGSDGICDTPYDIPNQDSKDIYPLMVPYNLRSLYAWANGPYIGCINEPVVFAGDAAGGSPPYAYYWDFGDGNNSTQQNPTHTYQVPGKYTATLMITDNNGTNASDSVTVTIRMIITWVDDDYNNSTVGWQIDHFDHVQDGIDTLTENGEVYVFNGTYYENIIINKTISLIGEESTTTIIDGGDNGDVVHITVDQVNISGFTIQGNGFPNEYANIHVHSNSNNIIGNIITDNVVGIWVEGSSNIISENVIRNNQYGIIPRASNNIIYHNNFISNYESNANEGKLLVNTWDKGYPLGGNYWDDHPDPHDNYSGVYQDQEGSDGIIDLGPPSGGLNPYDIPGRSNGKDYYPLINPIRLINYLPETPNQPSGLRFGLTNQTYIYSTNTTDPDGDLVQYGWDWDNDNIADIWTDFYDSGETVSVGHIWTTVGIYSVKVKARDEFDAESDWSEPLTVRIREIKKHLVQFLPP